MGAIIKLLYVFIFFKCVFSKEVPSISDPCNHNDVECLKMTSKKVFMTTSAGAPEYGMAPIDPLEIKKIKYTDPGSDIVMQFENIKITGLKNQKMNDFRMNTDTKAVVYLGNVEVDIVADVTMKIDKVTEISGTYNAKATSVETVSYNYSLNVDSDGVEHFTIGPETITCEPVGVPEVTLNLHSNVVAKDPNAVSRMDDYLKKAAEIKQKPVCKIITKAYKHVFAQIRSLANTLPKSAIFKDI